MKLWNYEKVNNEINLILFHFFDREGKMSVTLALDRNMSAANKSKPELYYRQHT